MLDESNSIGSHCNVWLGTTTPEQHLTQPSDGDILYDNMDVDDPNIIN